VNSERTTVMPSTRDLIESSDSISFIVSRLIESKQVGTIYHVMDTTKFIYMLRNNKLDAPTSFTRNKNYDAVAGREKNYTYQIVVDGDKLSDNFKVEPVDHSDGWVSDEAEEFVGSTINQIGKYITGIIVIRKKMLPWKSRGYDKGTYNDFFHGVTNTEISSTLLDFLEKYPHIKVFIKDGHGGSIHSANEELKWLKSMGIVNPKETEIVTKIQGVYKDKKLVLRNPRDLYKYVNNNRDEFYFEYDLNPESEYFGKVVSLGSLPVEEQTELISRINPQEFQELVVEEPNNYVVINLSKNEQNTFIIQIWYNKTTRKDLEFYKELASTAKRPIELVDISSHKEMMIDFDNNDNDLY